ncbi:MAG: pantoate--beta-alanine ligase [Phycisphaerales bacterium]|nr:pantoate--beta-alanine ligase [Phycisphaerales bacterium]
MEIVDRLEDLGAWAGVTLIPTMGALHEGHASLIRAAVSSGDRALVTVFVNPTQFGAGEDFGRYPRTLVGDLELAASSGASAVFLPSIEMVYPEGVSAAADQALSIALPPSATEPQLEEAWRPTHFGGVVQVVARLFDLCKPSRAFFGEKDYQQLRVITELVAMNPRRWPALKIIPCPTVRESDGLAMSSRNRFLNSQQRSSALGLSRALSAAGELAARSADCAQLEACMRAVLDSHGLEIQYAVVRHEGSLLATDCRAGVGRALIAATLGSVRLIDNARVSFARESG